jgi:mycofactocin system glycosyltransferase
VGPSPAARRLARRLVDSGVACPLPAAGNGPPPEDATVVVPVRDRPEGLLATLAALQGLNVLVVDDASLQPLPPGGHQVIRRQVPGGPGPARNTGWRSAATPIVVFLDADCVPEPGWLARLLPHFADPRVGAVAPRVRSMPGPGRLARYEEVMSPLDMGPAPAAVRPATRVAYVPTACLAVRRTALEVTGGFDEQLRFGEDVDLVWRLAGSGWVVRYDPEAVVSHPPRPDVGSLIRQRFDYGRSAAALAERHGSLVCPLEVAPWGGAAWLLATFGRPLPAAGLVAALSGSLAARAAPDLPTRRALACLAAETNLLTGKRIAAAVRRAWAPPLLLAVWIGPRRVRRRAAGWLLASLLLPLADWVAPPGRGERPGLGPVSWVALRCLDDLSYQSGVWAGAAEHRSPRALLPRVKPPGSAERLLRWRPPFRARPDRSPGSRASSEDGARSAGNR